MNTPAEYPCPCCGHRMFDLPPGNYDICRVCFWEDDNIQLRWPDWAGGANSLSLIDAQRAHAEMGAMEYRFTGIVRMAALDEPLDDGWRPIDLAVDDFEPRGVHDAPWPADMTSLYWWRPNFWRRR
ncbi:CPCC family cysteine-rich protein [Amycolatopsis sp. NPDC021455]|uniref:CPCC family cysteine-rich protein n=1 Tax=Amycolatopsis sp. NPDC021455 TaxID=3154901 RepID=UPI0034045ACC